MRRDDSRDWMWSEAVALIARAEQLQGSFFRPRQASRQAVWEPPADVLELESEVLILMALPGVDADQVETAVDDGALVVVGRRILPPELQMAVIHRLELPQGRFERRLPLPPGRYSNVRRSVANGCLIVSLQKSL
ncbi:Hsp20/alpha crystallin family protein [uncultured Rhodoblastus sp.]|uniref:Hsp20/alpha crystallin family protein n=1 Tax=uncultured Rhodoblastus sp. TaxID=543037 RepID=UPI0025DFC3F6|nr:Hsp20/alpha crystallin family protein [uncultured Rhodoblastus sp.]